MARNLFVAELTPSAAAVSPSVVFSVILFVSGSMEPTVIQPLEPPEVGDAPETSDANDCRRWSI